MANVCLTFGWLFDAKARVLYIPSWWKWNPPENVNVLKGSLKDLNEIPPCALVDSFAANIETLPQTLHETFAEGLRQRLPKGYRIQEQEQKQYQKQEQKPAALRVGESALKAVKSKTTNPHEVNNRLMRVVRDVLHEAPRNSELNYLIDTLQYTCRSQGLNELTRAEAIDVLTAAGQASSASA